ncbi:hypothetical protein DSO57_1030544 [Entomophthora muscae]|uniref:Uncharacterized protein n=1 Tax=Entomophthora muscae TaxID=34485 RepID=A0ACC2T143_9FUNG|nr:hypothetical protein DSO57_1030544 [Entomophthora muscae]
MEDGMYDEASQEKNRLEEKQREVRKNKEAQLQKALAEAPEENHAQIKKDLGHHPQWFIRDIDSDTGEGYWRFTQNYWKSRLHAPEARDNNSGKPWENVPDIF